MRTWNLLDMDAPNGTRDPLVLHSDDEARAVLIRIDAGQELGEHQVKERAWVCVVEGTVRVRAGGETMDAAPGTLLRFEADERRALGSDDGARILMLLAPWPGAGHYRGEHQAASA
jgi:quercetin dioxygenase-like cupin family protein